MYPGIEATHPAEDVRDVFRLSPTMVTDIDNIFQFRRAHLR
jgi:hypothetical protein